MRALVSHDSPVNQQIINLYLQLLSHQLGTTFLDTGFFSLLKDHGWSKVQSWFALQPPAYALGRTLALS
jgi:Ulp1 family protease